MRSSKNDEQHVDVNDNEDVFDHNDNKNSESNTGWSDSIASILKANKRKDSKSLVLSKAKKRNSVNETKLIPAGYQVATDSGEIKAEQVEKVTKSLVQLSRKKKKNEVLSVRMKPNILDRDRERILTKIATKGVVQLFNAVRMQQKDINAKMNEAGPLEVRRENVLKNVDKKHFLNILMGKKSEPVTEAENCILSKSKKDVSWSVLQDEYMMSAKLKDWDRELNKEVEME